MVERSKPVALIESRSLLVNRVHHHRIDRNGSFSRISQMHSAASRMLSNQIHGQSTDEGGRYRMLG